MAARKIAYHHMMPPKLLRLVDIIIEEALRPALAGNPFRRQGNQRRHPGQHLHGLLIHFFQRKKEHARFFRIDRPRKQRKASFDKQGKQNSPFVAFPVHLHALARQRFGKQVFHKDAVTGSRIFQRFPSIGPYIPIRAPAEHRGNHVLLLAHDLSQCFRFIRSRHPEADLGKPVADVISDKRACSAFPVPISQKHLPSPAFLLRQSS